MVIRLCCGRLQLVLLSREAVVGEGVAGVDGGRVFEVASGGQGVGVGREGRSGFFSRIIAHVTHNQIFLSDCTRHNYSSLFSDPQTAPAPPRPTPRPHSPTH